MVTAYVGLGSNLGEPERQIEQALELLAAEEGVQLRAVSTAFRRRKWSMRRSRAKRSSRRAVPRRSSQSVTRPFQPCSTYSSWPVTGVTTHVAAR